MIWIDRNFENGFQKLPGILSKNTATIELLRSLGLTQQEGHIWYSPVLLLQVVDRIQSMLGRIDSQNAEVYRRNSVQLSELIEAWGEKTRSQLMTSKPRYLLDHAFFSHFEKHMEVKSIAALHDANEQPPSIRELQRIESLLTRNPAKCLLHNESKPSKLAQIIAHKYSLPIYTIRQDPPDFMQGLWYISSTLLKCL